MLPQSRSSFLFFSWAAVLIQPISTTLAMSCLYPALCRRMNSRKILVKLDSYWCSSEKDKLNEIFQTCMETTWFREASDIRHDGRTKSVGHATSNIVKLLKTNHIPCKTTVHISHETQSTEHRASRRVAMICTNHLWWRCLGIKSHDHDLLSSDWREPFMPLDHPPALAFLCLQFMMSYKMDKNRDSLAC